MGKAKKGKEKAQAAPKCTCDHPYNCACGNRPPRPSKGHKWDPETQAWGGKGHQQKGASGQTASVSAQAKTTAVGKTQIAQWQRLPSQLLQEFCQRQKRPRAKYKNIEKKSDIFKYRVIVPDPKDSDKDLFFVPAASVANEEQAKEEACLLALLQLTPSLPHERKLPDPYKMTWLNAVNNQKKSAKEASKRSKADAATTSSQQKPDSTASTTQKSNSQGAQASTNLSMARSYSSLAERRKADQEKRQKRNARIRHHEAVRMANQNHPVFMSAQIRKQIEGLLRGKYEALQDNDDGNEEQLEDAENDVQEYVEQRLHSEGFTRRQSRTAFTEATRSGAKCAKVDEDDWDNVYEECLQWLLVHLDEDQLPEGFDPRGRTLDVVVPTSVVAARKADKENGSGVDYSQKDVDFASHYGISVQEAALIRERADAEKQSVEHVLWTTLCSLANVALDETMLESSEEAKNKEIAQEEVEALEAIFASDCTVNVDVDGLTTFSIALEEKGANLEVVVKNGVYPSARPERVLVSGKSLPTQSGVELHVQLIEYLGTLEPGEPMIFQIHVEVNALIASLSNFSPRSLLSILRPNELPVSEQKPARKEKAAARETQTTVLRRPRDRGHFWSTKPDKTPPAVPFPKIGKSLEATRKSLPATSSRKEFLSALKAAGQRGRVTLVEGATGCGKSTQIPQMILDEFPSQAKIVVCQPRRLAATGVAARVAEERGESRPGVDSVGYVVRGESAMSKRSRLVFCTTGVLLRQLQNKGALDCLTHIVIDEVHERHLDTDVLLGLLKQSLPMHPHLNVVLMSATLDADRFASYWGGSTPRLLIPGRTFLVADFMLEDVLSLTGYVPPRKKRRGNRNFQSRDWQTRSSSWMDSERSDGEPEDDDVERMLSSGRGISIEDLVKRVDETSVDYDLLATLVQHLIVNKAAGDDGSILIFLSGAPEINNALETIKGYTKGLPIHILPLHGGLQPKEQNQVFRPAGMGLTKVILSTNVAETSVTIPDCTVVIDSAREKQSSYDPTNRMPLLVEQFCSKASLKQRRGRAGRVREGVCYKLISKATYRKLREHGEPEIQRCALDQTLLSLLFLGVERSSSGAFMQTLLDPPSRESLEAASFCLRKLGAIEPEDGTGELKLTALGLHLAGIPAPPLVGKMLIMGSILGCRRASLAMAAGMSLGRSPFLRIDAPRRQKNVDGDGESPVEDLKRQRTLEERNALFKQVGNSDHAFLAAIFLEWEAVGAGSGNRKRLCDSLGLSFPAMRDMSQLVKQLGSSLEAAGYHESEESNRNANSWRLVRACAVAAMSPNQLVKVVRPATKYHDTAEGAKEKDGHAKELKFFVRAKDGAESGKGGTREHEERVFIHPSSANFAIGSYSCPWLVYNSLVRTSKPFLRDVTECNAYALLLFGGQLEVQASKGVIVVDKWCRLSSNARIGSLMGGLRRRVDEMLRKKISDPSFEIVTTKEMKLIVKLIKTDGLGT